MRRAKDLVRRRWRLPLSTSRWLSGLLGAACVAIGLIIVVRPLMSLDALTLAIAAGMVGGGSVDLIHATRPAGQATTHRRADAHSRTSLGSRAGRATDVAVPVAWIVAGVAVASWPGSTLEILVWLVGLSLVAAGVSGCARALRRGTAGSDRVAGLLLGAATAIVGVLALAWPDVSMLVVAVVFGARTLWFGVVSLWTAVRPHRRAPAAEAPEETHTEDGNGPRQERRRSGWMTVTVSLVAVLGALAAAGLSARIHSGRPIVDAFYTAPVPAPTEPGELIRAEPFTRDIPGGAAGWRILYSTTDGSGRARAASALVVAPADTAAHPVIAWAHGTTGYDSPCAPSLAAQPFESGALFLLDDVIAHGWALVATDYAGLGTTGPQPYLIGEGEARSVLDAVRAARQLTATHLSDKTVVWGHSQGGHSALWTGQIAGEYAPDIPLAGVAALAPASDLTAFATETATMTGGSVFASYVISAYSQTYSDVPFSRYVRPAARVLVQQMATRCLAEPGILVSVLTALSLTRDPVIWSQDPTTGPLGDRLAQNVPRGPFPMPVLIAQGESDSLILPAMQRHFVSALCASGQAVDYRTYADREHVSLVQVDSPLIGDLMTWTEARFADRPATLTCPPHVGD